MAHKHILSFEGDVPEDEAERAEIHAHPAVKAAKAALVEALAEAGHPHTMKGVIVRTKAPGAASRGGRKPKLAAAE